MKVLFIAPQARPHVLDVVDIKLRNMTALVGGMIQQVILVPTVRGQNGIALLCNEEGLLHGMCPNFILPDGTPIVGNAVIVGMITHNWCALTDADVTEWVKNVKGWQRYAPDYINKVKA